MCQTMDAKRCDLLLKKQMRYDAWYDASVAS